MGLSVINQYKHSVVQTVDRIHFKSFSNRYFSGQGPFPAILDMFGAAGGLVEYRAALLARHGIMSLALAYFRYDDLPKSMNALDIDYGEEAADWLFKHPKVSIDS